MINAEFEEKINNILAGDTRFPAQAYELISDAVAFLSARRRQNGDTGHVSGKELVEGVLNFVANEYGVLSAVLLQRWKVCKAADVGEVVFNMVGVGLLAVSEEDSRQDFEFELDLIDALHQVFAVDAGRRRCIPTIV